MSLKFFSSEIFLLSVSLKFFFESSVSLKIFSSEIFFGRLGGWQMRQSRPEPKRSVQKGRNTPTMSAVAKPRLLPVSVIVENLKKLRLCDPDLQGKRLIPKADLAKAISALRSSGTVIWNDVVAKRKGCSLPLPPSVKASIGEASVDALDAAQLPQAAAKLAGHKLADSFLRDDRISTALCQLAERCNHALTKEEVLQTLPAATEAKTPFSTPVAEARAEAESSETWALTTRTYKSLLVMRRVSDGYFNATQLCSHFRKEFYDYERTARVSEYLDALARSLKSMPANPGVDLSAARASLVQVQNGGPRRGSWIHERLAVDLARWLSPDFAVWMDGWVLEALGLASRSGTRVSERSFVPRDPLVIKDDASVGLPGNDHLYAALRVGENCIKVGVSKDVLERIKALAQKFEGHYELLAVWPHEAVLEDIVLDLLKPSKAQVGTSREHFDATASFEYICQIVRAARNLYRLKTDLDTPSTKRRREDMELQEDLADRALRRKMEEQRNALLHDLVLQGDADAKQVFLAKISA